ncbi:hypothetical protein OsccyDRAFT_4029 [Leptolyngbyaceae cyanobacterium JSC-12]|nr:hypothetical protein OsccyDRAFT_4029 [Leptolyngbyaceae cyanobacterium JSC-12]
MKGLDAIQVEQLRQIGDYLRRVREQQAVALDRVSQETFIPLRLLQALEASEIERLPEPVYVKGFIRRYGDALGLDGSEIADAFDIDLAPVPQAIAESPRESSTDPAEPQQRQVQPQKVTDQRSKHPVITYALSGIAAVAVLGAIAIGLASVFKPAANTAVNVPSSPSTVSQSDPVPRPEVSSSDAIAPQPTIAATPKPASGEPVQVDISLTDRSWMEVVADGKVEFEGILAKGEQRTWTAKNNVSIRAGNAGAVLVSHNHGEAKPLGKLGDVVDANFSSKKPSP